MWTLYLPKELSRQNKLVWLIKVYNILIKLSRTQFNYIVNKNQLISGFSVSGADTSLRNHKVSSFKSFIHTASSTPSGRLKIHYSNKQLFNISTGGVGNYSSIEKFYIIYTRFYDLVYCLIYYDIKLFLFGNSIFKNEITALNWGYLSYYFSSVKYSVLTIFFNSNKLNDKLPKLFRVFRENDFSTAFVFDVMYHKSTIYYLQRLHFFSVGISPSNLPRYTLNVSIPSLNETLLTHLFFIRLAISIKQFILKSKFERNFSYWNE